MDSEFSTYTSLGSALNARYRGHDDRDWEKWQAKHFYADASVVPENAERVWLGGESKLSYRGLADKHTIRHLIIGKADQACIEEIGRMEKLERLELEYPVLAEDVSPLLALKGLRHLSIDTPRKLADFSPLLKLPALRKLLITSPKHMADLDWLHVAHHLEVIGIEGGIWSTIPIPSLKPIAGLSSLQAFLGTSTKLLDGNVMPLAECPNLNFIGIARVAPREEFDRLSQARPDVYCSWFHPESWPQKARRRG